MKKQTQPRHGAADLMLFADSIQGHARRLKNLATWNDVIQQNAAARAAGEPPDTTTLLRVFQASRFNGIDNDVGFFIVCLMAESHAENIFETDRELNELRGKIRAIEKREGLGEFDEFDPDHPETPADWKALIAESDRRHQEVEKIRDDRLIRWLRRHGETDMADLYANDRAAFDRRREAGACKIYGPLPDINPDIGDGNANMPNNHGGQMKPAPQKSCAATKRNGEACQAAALPGSRFCFFHSPGHADARREAQSRGGLANKMATLPADAPDVKVEDGGDVVKLLSATINQVRRGEIDPRVANAVGYLSNIALAATDRRELESRIAELESLVKNRRPAE